MSDHVMVSNSQEISVRPLLKFAMLGVSNVSLLVLHRYSSDLNTYKMHHKLKVV